MSVARILLVLTLVAGCAGPPADVTPTPTQTPAPSAAESAASSEAPAATEPAVPRAVLVLANGRTVEGKLGSYTFRGAGSDSPWIPAQALEDIAVKSGERIRIRLQGGLLIGSCTAQIARADDRQGTKPAKFATVTSGPTNTVDAAAPNDGSWVLAATLQFGDGSGSGSYYWELDVR